MEESVLFTNCLRIMRMWNRPRFVMGIVIGIPRFIRKKGTRFSISLVGKRDNIDWYVGRAVANVGGGNREMANDWMCSFNAIGLSC
jgi:hypothetical protein